MFNNSWEGHYLFFYYKCYWYKGHITYNLFLKIKRNILYSKFYIDHWFSQNGLWFLPNSCIYSKPAVAIHPSLADKYLINIHFSKGVAHATEVQTWMLADFFLYIHKQDKSETTKSMIDYTHSSMTGVASLLIR